jgi:hypothetical protein
LFYRPPETPNAACQHPRGREGGQAKRVRISYSTPSRGFQSAWMGIIVHSAQSVVIIGVVLALVLA